MLAVFGLALGAFCADQNLPLLPCAQGSPGTPGCNPSKKDLKEAKAAFAKGLKLQHRQHMDEAFDQFETAARLVPQDFEYVTAREMTRQQLVFDRLERGNADLLKGRQVEALAEFRGALQLDPRNEFAQQRLGDALGRARKVSVPFSSSPASHASTMPSRSPSWNRKRTASQSRFGPAATAASMTRGSASRPTSPCAGSAG